MFTLRKIEGGRINVFEPVVYPVGSSAVTEGEALVLTSGKLTKCGATVKPTFIALANGAVGAEIPVGRVESNQVYEVATSADASALAVGAKVTLGDDGLTVTATTNSGVAEIVDLNGATKTGDTIYVRF
jgi:hypothetical protein